MRNVKRLLIVIFPYFFIFEKDGLDIDDLKIKPSYKENINNEPENVRKRLLDISMIFKFGSNRQISYWSYTYGYISNSKELALIKNKLDKLSTIIRYTQLADPSGNARFEHFNYFLFEIANSELNFEDNYFYYGSLNGQSSISYYKQNGNFENHYVSVTELQPLFIEIKQLKQKEFFTAVYYSNDIVFRQEVDRIIKSIEWFNRSFSHYGRGVDLNEAILNIETAFESLLRPGDDIQGIRAQIKTALFSLLGYSKELNAWFDKFWELRNSIVHGEVNVKSLQYKHPKGTKGHRHHLQISRKIFVKCLDIILKARLEFPLMDFEQELISNEVRLKDAMKLLKKKKTKIAQNIIAFRIVSGLRTDDISATKNQTKQLGSLLLPYIREDLLSIDTEDSVRGIIARIDEIIKWHGKRDGDLAVLYSRLEQNYRDIYFRSNLSIAMDTLALRNAAVSYFNYATWRLLYSMD